MKKGGRAGEKRNDGRMRKDVESSNEGQKRKGRAGQLRGTEEERGEGK